jgi:hypothetical protein
MSCTRKPKAPRYDERKGWTGGDSRTLYAVVDKASNAVVVRPGNAMRGIGPGVTVRVATRAEAVQHWQADLSPGWKVACKSSSSS